MSKHIFWISSYPKSGNTLLRAILSSIFFTNDGLFNFELLKNIPQIENTINLEFIKNNNPKDYNEIHKLEVLSKYWETIQSKKNLEFEGDFIFIKTHHALIEFLNNSFTSRSSTRGLIYVVRDPRDVAVSYSAKHLNKTTDDVIDLIINPDVISRTTKDTLGLPMIHLNWEQFYRSWFSIDVPKLLLKYEDMKKNPKKAIMDILNFFKNEYNFQFNNEDNLIANILKTTDFKTLKTKEKEKGLIDNKKGAYFRSGQTNEWLNKLTLTQIKKIESNFNELMKEFGYL